jgi:hypothetical protein
LEQKAIILQHPLISHGLFSASMARLEAAALAIFLLAPLPVNVPQWTFNSTSILPSSNTLAALLRELPEIMNKY